MDKVINIINWALEHWISILAAIVCGMALIAKLRKWLDMDAEERFKSLRESVRLVMLALVTEAEKLYGGGTGSLKRSYVLEQIFRMFPDIGKLISKETIVKMLDNMIDTALAELREMLETNPGFFDRINDTITLEGELLEGVAVEDLIKEGPAND